MDLYTCDNCFYVFNFFAAPQELCTICQSPLRKMKEEEANLLFERNKALTKNKCECGRKCSC